MGIDTITNYLALPGGIASSGQPEEHQFRFIAEQGYGVVINLAMPNSENAIPEEGYIVTARSMRYAHIPVPFDAPGEDHLAEFLSVMKAFSGHRRWVHCVVNYRASAFLYHYWRRVLGAGPEEAARVMLPGWKPDPVWQRFLALRT